MSEKKEQLSYKEYGILGAVLFILILLFWFIVLPAMKKAIMY